MLLKALLEKLECPVLVAQVRINVREPAGISSGIPFGIFEFLLPQPAHAVLLGGSSESRELLRRGASYECEISQRYFFVRVGLRGGENLESARLSDSGQKSGRRPGIPSKQRARHRRLAAI